MIAQETTMITNFFEEDISKYNYHFPNGECIISSTFNNYNDWKVTVQNASRMLKEHTKIFNYNRHLFLWVRSDSFYNPTKLRRVKGIWNNTDLKWLTKEQCLLYSHVNCNEEVYSAIARIMDSQLELCIDYLRCNKTAYLFLIDETHQSINLFDEYLYLNCNNIEDIFEFSFNHHFILIRVTGNFDDRKLEIDFCGHKSDILNILK